MTEHTPEEVANQIAQTGYHLAAQNCLGCGPGPIDPTCGYCEGTGTLRHVPWVPEPWSRVAPGLWVGGHQYSPNGGWDLRTVTPEELAEADFDVVVSLFRGIPEVNGIAESAPRENVVHIEHLFGDDPFSMRSQAAIETVWGIAQTVSSYIDDEAEVLVRCHAGMNRSSLVAALAMVNLGIEPQEAIDLIRQHRSRFALFNTSFVDLILAQQPKERARG